MGEPLSSSQIIYSKRIVYAGVDRIGDFCFYFNYRLVWKRIDFGDWLAAGGVDGQRSKGQGTRDKGRVDIFDNFYRGDGFDLSCFNFHINSLALERTLLASLIEFLASSKICLGMVLANLMYNDLFFISFSSRANRSPKSWNSRETY